MKFSTRNHSYSIYLTMIIHERREVSAREVNMPVAICFFVFLILQRVLLCIDQAHIATKEQRTIDSNTTNKSFERLGKERTLTSRFLFCLDSSIFLDSWGSTHDRWIFRGGLFVLFEVSLKHIFLFLHFLFYFLVEILVSLVIIFPDLFVVCHNYNQNEAAQQLNVESIHSKTICLLVFPRLKFGKALLLLFVRRPSLIPSGLMDIELVVSLRVQSACDGSRLQSIS